MSRKYFLEKLEFTGSYLNIIIMIIIHYKTLQHNVIHIDISQSLHLYSIVSDLHLGKKINGLFYVKLKKSRV